MLNQKIKKWWNNPINEEKIKIRNDKISKKLKGRPSPLRGKISWKKGKTLEEICKDNPEKVEEMKKKSSEIMKKRWKENPDLGVHRGEENGMYGSARFGSKNPMFGKKHSKETKLKIGLKAIGRKISEETRKKFIGRIPWNKGMEGWSAGKLNGNWNGGSSFLPYSLEWTQERKKIIRERDHYTCQNCWKKWENGKKQFSIHHIDYNKLNCNPENLITLCQNCHNKTNGAKNRKYFIEKLSKSIYK